MLFKTLKYQCSRLTLCLTSSCNTFQVQESPLQIVRQNMKGLRKLEEGVPLSISAITLMYYHLKQLPLVHKMT